MKRLFAMLMVTLATLSFGNDLTIVKSGKANAVILLDEKPTSASQMGALELNNYLKLISGAELPVYYGKAPADAANIIRISACRPDKSGEFYSVKFNKNEVVLSGNDSAVFSKVDYQDYKTFPKFEYTFNGSLWAVYDFLENGLNVHFYGLSERDTTYTPRTDVVVKPFDKSFTPPLDAFRYINNDDNARVSKLKFSHREEALWRLRWRQTSFFGRTNHNGYSIYFAHWDKASRPGFDKAFKGKKPEIFAKGYDGKNAGVDPILRSNYQDDKNIPPQLCYSNPDAVKYYADEVLTYFNGKNVIGGWNNFSAQLDTNLPLLPRIPGKPYFYPVQGGDTGGHCLCKDCRSRFPDDNPENVSNNKFQFVADVANQVAKTDKNAGVSTLAYIHTAQYPTKVKLPDNVSVQLCLTNYAWWHPVAYKLQHDAYKEWINKEAKKRPITLWTYTFGSTWDADHHFGKYEPFPTFYPWVIAKQLKEFTNDGIRGYFTEVEMQFNTLEAYVSSKIAFDPSLDPNLLISEYFRNAYGDAGKTMEEFYKEVEKSFFNPENAPKEWLVDSNKLVGPKGVKHPYWGTGLLSPQINWGKAGTPERMAKLKALLAQAQKQVKTDAEKARLKYFTDVIWSKALKGEADYELLRKRLEAPPQLLTLSKIDNANGDITKINPAQFTSTSKWLSLNGEDVNSTSNMQVAMDDNYLYLKYSDQLNPEVDRDIWRENIELFFTNAAKNPVFQFALAPNGTVSSYKYVKNGAVYKMDNFDLNAKVQNQAEPNSWSASIAIPLASLNMEKSSAMLLNFIRTRREGTTIWSPIFCSAYLDGLESMGRLGFFPQRFTAKDFTYTEKGKMTDIVNDENSTLGQVGMMKGDFGWALQCKIPFNYSARYDYDVSIKVRAELVADSDKSNFGVYDAKFRKVVGAKVIKLSEINGKSYKEIHLGRFKLSPDMFIYIGGVNPKNPNNKIFLESVEIKIAK